MSFTQDMRIHEHTNSFYKSARESWPGINLLVSNETETAFTAITFHAGMTTDLDVTYDAGLFGGNQKFSLYSHLVEDNGVNFMLQCLPEMDTVDVIIPLGFDYKDGGSVTFSAETIGLEGLFGVVLEDRLLEVFTDLSDESSSYSTMIDANSSGMGRFYLHTYTIPNEPADPTDPADPEALSADMALPLLIYSADVEIVISGDTGENAHARLFNLSVSLIKTWELMPSGVSILSATDIQEGIYFLFIFSDHMNESTKIMIH